MKEIEILHQIEKELNIKFKKTVKLINIYFDTENKEALYYIEKEKILGLKIKNYNIGKIPEQIKNLKNLTALSLNGNGITDISLLGGLTKLKALDLSNNNINDISPLNKLYNLELLKLNSNKITKLANIQNLKKVKKLYLDHNLIKEIENISNLKTLKEISLKENKISDIQSILKISSLSKINLSQNLIKKITNIPRHENIRELDLSHNQIKDIEEITKLRKLIRLDVSHNKISKLPDLKEKKDLNINISYNNITDPDEFSKLPPNKAFFTTGNPASLLAYSFKEPQKAVLDVDILKAAIKRIFPLFSTEKAGMVGIFGRWGRGKTFFWKQLKKDLEQESYETLEFSAWKYNDTPATWVYFYEILANKIHGKPEMLKPFKVFIFKLIDSPIQTLFYVFLFVLLPVLFFIYIFKNPDLISGNFELANGVALKIGTSVTYLVFFIYYFTKIYSINVNNIFKQMQQNKFSQVLGMQAEIEKHLKILLRNYKKKLIVFVDDLDRCDEDKILSIIHALRIIIENKEISSKIIIITAVDETILKDVIKNRYKDLQVRNLDLMVKEYMEKLFVFSIKLPALNESQLINIANNYADSVFRNSHISVKTTKEYSLFTDYLKKTKKQLTPRQVKNVYNRYFFSINLFSKKFKEISDNELQLICALSFIFSFDKDISEIDNYMKEKVKFSDNIAKCTIFDKEIQIPKNKWQEILNIIKTAVAY